MGVTNIQDKEDMSYIDLEFGVIHGLSESRDTIDPDFGIIHDGTSESEDIIDPEFSVSHGPQYPDAVPYKVYGKIKNNLVTKFYSTCFEDFVEGDVFLKEGFGDEYIHVAYLEVYDKNLCHNYKVIEEVDNTIDNTENMVYDVDKAVTPQTKKVIVETTPEERAAELANIPAPPKGEFEKLVDRVELVEGDSAFLFQGVSDADTKAIKATTKATSAESTANFATEDIAVVSEAVFGHDASIADIVKKMKAMQDQIDALTNTNKPV